MKRKNKILQIISLNSLISSFLLLTSCSNVNNDNYNEEYDENQIIIKDFTIKDSKECAKAYLNFCENTKDFTHY